MLDVHLFQCLCLNKACFKVVANKMFFQQLYSYAVIKYYAN